MSGYLINQSIFFDPATCMLHNIADPSVCQTLNAMTSRCLIALLDNHGNVLSREELLESGWGMSGVIVASNSLNQAISQLRKVFKQLGEASEIITTVSREGYRITVAVNIELLDFQVAPAVSRPDLPAVVPGTPDKHSSARVGKKMVLLVAFTIMIMMILFYFVKNDRIDVIYEADNPIGSGVNVFIQNSLQIKKNYQEQARNIILNDPDIRKIIISHPDPYVYINDTVRSDVFSFFICSGDIYLIESNCASFSVIED